MLEQLKDAFAENWKGALIGAVIAAAILLGAPTNFVLGVNNMFNDEDPLAELCADYEPAVEAPAEPAPDAGVTDAPDVGVVAEDAGTAKVPDVGAAD